MFALIYEVKCQKTRMRTGGELHRFSDLPSSLQDTYVSCLVDLITLSYWPIKQKSYFQFLFFFLKNKFGNIQGSIQNKTVKLGKKLKISKIGDTRLCFTTQTMRTFEVQTHDRVAGHVPGRVCIQCWVTWSCRRLCLRPCSIRTWSTQSCGVTVCGTRLFDKSCPKPCAA